MKRTYATQLTFAMVLSSTPLHALSPMADLPIPSFKRVCTFFVSRNNPDGTSSQEQKPLTMNENSRVTINYASFSKELLGIEASALGVMARAKVENFPDPRLEIEIG